MKFENPLKQSLLFTFPFMNPWNLKEPNLDLEMISYCVSVKDLYHTVLLYVTVFLEHLSWIQPFDGTYIESVSISVMLVSSFSFVTSWNGRCNPILSVAIFLALYFWSPKKGIPSIGTPWYTASWKLCSPHCVINNLILGWAGKWEKQNIISQKR